jgi:hypothetical protein
MLIRCFWFINILVFACTCASPGSLTSPTKHRRKPKEKTAREKSQEKKKEETTGVGLGLLGSDLPIPASCVLPQAVATLVDLEGRFNLDGHLDDWPLKPIFEDTVGDNIVGLDLASTQLGLNAKDDRQDIVGAIKFVSSDVQQKIDAGSTIYIEFGKMSIEPNQLRQIAQRLYRFDKQGFAEYFNGAWNTFATAELPSIKGGFKISGSQLEWMLDRRQIDDVKTASAWWVRVYTNTPQGTSDDSTTAQFLPKAGGDEAATLTIANCVTAVTKSSRILVQEIRENSLAKTADTAFNVIRLALDDAIEAFGAEIFPEKSIAIILTTKGFPGVDLHFPIQEEDQSSLGFVYSLGSDDLRNIQQGHYEGVYKDAASRILNLFLYKKFRSGPSYLRKSVGFALQDYLELKRLNNSRWLSYYRSFVMPFVGRSDVELPVPLKVLQEQIAESEDEAEKAQLREILSSKINSFGHILAANLKHKELLSAWVQASAVSSASAEEQFTTALRDVLVDAGSSFDSTLLWPGWLIDGSYDPSFAPDILADADDDGLPNYYEVRNGTNPREEDSDHDGWADYAELTTMNDPLNSASKPNVIVADNYFGDWEELLPISIKSQLERINKGCPEASQITSVAAIVDDRKLILASYAAEKWNRGLPISWEAQVDLVNIKRKFLIYSQSGSHNHFIKDVKSNTVVAKVYTPMPQALQTVEWLINFEDIGIDRKMLKKNKVIKIKFASIYDTATRALCNESEWFSPLVSE